MPETDAELVRRVRRGEREAFDRLVRRHLKAAYAVALSVLGEPTDAEDVCQDAFVTAVERIHDLRDPAQFSGWLFQIVRNRSRQFRRSEAIRRHLPLDRSQTLAAGGESPALAAERAELRARLLAALAELPEERREVILLHDLHGWKHREIAERLGLPEGTVRSHLHHARRALRPLLSSDLRAEG